MRWKAILHVVGVPYFLGHSIPQCSIYLCIGEKVTMHQVLILLKFASLGWLLVFLGCYYGYDMFHH